MKIDIVALDKEYEKFQSSDDDMSNLTNVKITKAKNVDFRLKLDAWKNMALTRKSLKKRAYEHGKAIRQSFESSLALFNVDKDKIRACSDEYNSFFEDKTRHARDQKTINNFLCELPEGSHQVLEHQDLERLA